MTNQAGTVGFKGLPSGVRYALAIKKPGYETIEESLPERNSSNDLTLDRTLTLQERTLRVELTSPYYEKTEVFHGLEVVLTGLVDTNTEDILCKLTEGEAPDVRLFDQLVASRYELRIEGRGDAADLEIHPYFEFVDYIDLYDEELVFEAELQLRLAHLSGRLMAADDKGFPNSTGKEHPSDYLPFGSPRYRPQVDRAIEVYDKMQEEIERTSNAVRARMGRLPDGREARSEKREARSGRLRRGRGAIEDGRYIERDAGEELGVDGGGDGGGGAAADPRGGEGAG